MGKLVQPRPSDRSYQPLAAVRSPVDRYHVTGEKKLEMIAGEKKRHVRESSGRPKRPRGNPPTGEPKRRIATAQHDVGRRLQRIHEVRAQSPALSANSSRRVSTADTSRERVDTRVEGRVDRVRGSSPRRLPRSRRSRCCRSLSRTHPIAGAIASVQAERTPGLRRRGHSSAP